LFAYFADVFQTCDQIIYFVFTVLLLP